jgi:AcrR family transcriptional regulator
MKDIATEMGVSLMTVSKALRNKSDIGEETRRRIVERASELKYQPNLIARSLVSRRSYALREPLHNRLIIQHENVPRLGMPVIRALDELFTVILLGRREEDGKARPSVGRTADPNAPTVVTRYAANGRESEATTARVCGEERLEDAIHCFAIHPAPSILDFEEDVINRPAEDLPIRRHWPPASRRHLS